MPTISQNHKQTYKAEKQPFKLAFLLPQYWGIWLFLAILLPLIYLPLRFQFWIGKQLGILFYTVAKSRRKVTLVNLALAFPEKMSEDRERMAKQVFVNQGIGLFETLCAWYRPDVFTRTVSISGLHHLIEAQKANKAVLLLGGHYTMLDLGGRLFTQFLPIDCVYRPQNNKLLDWFIYNGRRHIFDEQIDHRNMKKLVSRMRDAKIIWYSPDQDYGLKNGIMAPFFGVPAASVTAPRRLARLGHKSNPPVVMALHTYRQSPDKLQRGRRPHYHLTITPALNNYPTTDELADATRVNEVLESLIRIDPTQWMWFHKRYKHNEAGRTDYYN
ncbi:lipid A biosynthesis acyltransferase [Psychrobacter sp.]|uniref:LpxL/LpxP family acyltransferase n=1 Tax=Psychrobacter sp. TaxID=56811 RepID=UPI0025CFC1F9|nr:lipid A biosynthesis acyltransferase [Psychrobacter sp.]